MYIISVNGTNYKCLESWREMTVAKAIEIQQILDDIPTLIRELYDLHVSKSDTRDEDINKLHAKISVEDRIKIFPLFYGEIIRVFTDIPGEVMSQIMWDMRTEFYKAYCEKLVLGLLYGDYSNIKNIESFEFRDVDKPLIIETYILPTSDHALANPDKSEQKMESKPMANTQTIEFTEVADLEIYGEQGTGGKYQVAANIISILCRPKGEVYDEKTSLRRADIFMDLTMDIVWEVFFCIHQLSTISSQNMLIYKLEKDLEIQKSLKRAGLKRSGGMVAYLKLLKRKFLTEVGSERVQ